MDDNLTGLCSFLAQTGGVGGDPVDMAADFIGAVAGVQYRFSYEAVSYTHLLFACRPRPFSYTIPPTVMGLPSMDWSMPGVFPSQPWVIGCAGSRSET